MSTVSITPTPELSGTVPRIKLDVSDSGIPSYTAVNVVRHNPDGRTVPVRTGDGLALPLATSGANRIGTVYDYEAPFGQSVTYSTIENPATVSAPVTLNESRVWLINPGVPELSAPITVAEFSPRIRAAVRAVYHPLGRREPVVHTDGTRRAPSGTVVIKTETLDELRQLEAITEDSGTLLLNIPAGLGWGFETSYVSVGDIEEARLIEYAAEPHRYHSLPYQVVARPVGGTQAERTWTDVIANYATWADVMAEYDTWLDVIGGP